MPYNIGEQGSYGCSGYPVVKEGTSDVMGCHSTRESAANQIMAIEANEKGVGIANPEEWPIGKALPDAYGPASDPDVPEGRNCANCIFYDTSKVLDGKAYCTKWDDYVRADYYCKAWKAEIEMDKAQTDKDGMGSMVGQPYAASNKDSVLKDPKKKPGRSIGGAGGSSSGAVATTGGGSGMGTKMEDEENYDLSNRVVSKEDGAQEGSFVIAMTTEGPIVGQVEHVMREGGSYGEPGNPYAVMSTPENPAVAIRILEEDDGMYYYTPYSIGALMSNVKPIDTPNIDMEDDMEELERLAKDSPCWDGYRQEGMKPGRNGGMVPNCVPVKKYHEAVIRKAESYSPTSGMKAAARRALKWKADGKATGAGTPVGWGRATDIVAGRSMSLSTVRRMFSFFSRHEAASKGGKDFNNTSNPSNGRIMWDAWGGNAGFTWSRAIVNRMKDKALFSNFGKDYTRSEAMGDLFKSLGVGSMVSWNSSGGRAQGKITRIIRNGSYNVPGTSVTVTGTPEEPAAVIRLYRDGKPTDTIVAHKIKTLRAL